MASGFRRGLAARAWLLLVDLLGWFRWLADACGVRASALATVWVDPLRVSDRPIWLHPPVGAPPKARASRGGAADPRDRQAIPWPEAHAFRVEATDTRDQRAVSWLYRWRQEPDAICWRESMAVIGRPPAVIPTHRLVLLDRSGAPLGEALLILVTAESPSATLRRRIQHFRPGKDPRWLEGPALLGGLVPSRMIRDARAACSQ